MSDTIEGVIADLEAIDAQHVEDTLALSAKLRQVIEQRNRALKALKLCEAGTPVDPGDPGTDPVKPPVVVPPDPPVVPPDPPTGQRPGEDLDWAVRPKPVLEDCDWVIQGGTITSRRGLPAYAVDGDQPDSGIGGAYRASREAGQRGAVIFGIYGDAGEARVGGLYNSLTWPSHEDITWQGEGKSSATFLGLDDTASVALVFSASTGRATPTGDVMAFDIGLRGPSDSFVIRANAGSDHVQLDGCWFLNGVTKTGLYDSGLHIDGWDTLVIRNHKWRGETPGSPGLKFQQHPLAYLKAGRTSTLLELNDLYGGNRCGFQKRPQNKHQPLATDRLMIRNNHCDNYGDNWEHGDGGGVYTVWLSNGGTYFYDNEAVNFRFSALVVSPQFGDRNYEFLASRNQHDRIYVSGNRFEPGPLTERSTATISACDYVRLYADNQFGGQVVLDSHTAHNYSPHLRNQKVEIWVPAGAEAPAWDLRQYDISLDEQRRMTPAEIQAMVVTVEDRA